MSYQRFADKKIKALPRKPGRPRNDDVERHNAINRRIEIACQRIANTQGLALLEKALDEAKTPGLDFRVRLEALRLILDRGFGKAKNRTEMSGHVEVNNTHEFRDVWNEALKRVAQKPETEQATPPADQPESECNSSHPVH